MTSTSMRNDLARRLGRVEIARGAEMSPAVKQWLGYSITDAERASIASQPPMTEQEREAALAGCSAELRDWLRGGPSITA